MSVRYATGRIVLLVSVLACSQDDQAKSSGMQIDTVGDTIVMKALGSGPWGDEAALVEELRIGELDGAEEYVFGRISDVVADAQGTILVLDQQARAVRRYSPDGEYLGSIGRAGSGPGELGSYASGMIFLPDGRLLVRDFRNSRINIYAVDGTPAGQLPIPAGFSTSEPLRADTAGYVYTQAVFDRMDDGTFTSGLLKLDLAGTVLDSIRQPFAEFKTPRLIASRGDAQNRSVSVAGVPFTPRAHWLLDRAGQLSGAISNRYAIDTYLPDGKVRRITRDIEPVAVQAGEKATSEERITRGMRNMDPSWRWNGPAIPDTKPPFSQIALDADGRFWMQLSQPANRLPPDPDARPDPAGLPPLDRWNEPIVYDVFEPDGQFLGTVHVPERTRLMYMRGDQVWAVQTDESDVQYVVRFRIVTNATKQR